MKQILNPRAGSYIYKGYETPIVNKIFTIKSGQECTLRGVLKENNKFFARIFVFDSGEEKIIDFSLIEKYL